MAIATENQRRPFGGHLHRDYARRRGARTGGRPCPSRSRSLFSISTTTTGPVKFATSDKSTRRGWSTSRTTLRQDLAASGRYRIVYPACDPAPCTAAGADPATLVADARKAGARLMMFGGVHKMSTLMEWAKLLVIDVQTEQVVFDRLITFRG